MESIAEIKIKESYDYQDGQSKKLLKVFPVKISLRSMPQIKLNEENLDFRWITPNEVKKYNAVPELESTINNALI